MSAVLGRPPGLGLPFSLATRLRRERGLVMAVGVFIVVFGGLNLALAKPFGYYDFASTLSNTTTLALAAIGQTLVVLMGGLDLSAGAVVSLSNCLFVWGVGSATTPLTGLLWAVLSIGAGVVAGAANGFFIARLRLQPIVVTLANMFVVQGVTLLIQPEPGGSVSPDFTVVFTGDLIPGVVPASLGVLGAALLLWALLRRTRLGVAIYAVGSDEDAARASGVRAVGVKWITYCLAGGCYGFAGVFLSAQTGSADPLVGSAMLLPIFVAVLLGGTHMGGGRGGCVGTVFGSLTLMLIVNLLLVMKVSTYFSTAAEGLLLILAVLGNSFSPGSPLWQQLRLVRARLRRLVAPRASSPAPAPLRMASDREGDRVDDELPASPLLAWLARHRSALRLILPAYVALVLVLAVTAAVLGHRVTLGGYVSSLLVLASIPAVIVLGQGIVIVTGGLDLSMPWMVTLGGVLVAGMSNGSNESLSWAAPAVLLISAAIGAVNGIGIAVLGISPIVMTLAMGGILQAAALIYCNGSPVSLVPSGLHWLMRGDLAFSLSPVAWLLLPFVIGASLLLVHTTFGRRLYAIGNSVRVAELAGVPVAPVLVASYALSAVCAGCVGFMLSGFGYQATLDMGDAILMPSIAAAVMGGTLITGGRGHYVGMFGGALLLTALTTLLSGILLPAAARDIVFGGVVLMAVIALRERSGH